MHRTRALLALAILCVALVAPGAQATKDGCIAVGTGAVSPMNIRPWDCSFVASGPSVYTANTTNPFVIAVWREGRWVELVRRPVAGAPRFGILTTAKGELVSVSISCWDYTGNAPCSPHGVRTGLVVAHSEI